MVSVNDFPTIDLLDLEPIKVKLMHQKAGKGWSLERANAVELEYRRFLCLAKKFPNEPIAPVVDVDEFWHYHILDTKKYADDCQRIFGYFLHHFPYAGMRGKEDEEALQRVGKRTGALYEQAFEQAYMSDLAAVGGRVRTAMSSGVRLNAAYGAPAVEPAYCYSATVEPAYCYATVAKKSSEPAYCYATVADKSTEPAYCYATVAAKSAEPAYCYATVADKTAEPAYCYATVAKNSAEPAYCYATAAKKSAEPAYCYATVAASYCSATSEHLARENFSGALTAAAQETAYCFIQPPRTTGRTASRAPEERLGFYLERPRLANA